MSAGNGRGRAFDDEDEDSAGDEEFDPAEYDAMLLLERLESMEEEMLDLGVSSLDDVRRRIAALHRELDDKLGNSNK
jgi:hypothetical protein